MKRFLPLAILALCLAYVLSTLRSERNTGAFDIAGFGRLPVLVNGRVKPFDSVARNSLLVLQGRQRVKTPEGATLSPSEWLLDVTFRPERAETYQVVEIMHSEVLDMLGFSTADGAAKKRFSIKQIAPKFDELSRQARMASEVDAAHRDSFQRAVLKLYTHVDPTQKLRYSLLPPGATDSLGELKAFEASIQPGLAAMKAKREGKPHDEAALKAVLDQANRYGIMAESAYLNPIPPAPGAKEDDWRSVGSSLQGSFETGRVEPDVLVIAGLAYAWREQKPTEFNEIVRLSSERLAGTRPSVMRKAGVEMLFNSAQPFYTSTVLYVLSFLLAVGSWLVAPASLRKAAMQVLLLAFLLSTAGIFVRMWLESRPPVTNLYSSALFVGWGVVALCLILEFIYKNSVASAAAGFVGFCTLIIAHHLSLGGDTMEMMRAVLDSNFWLATHVVTISIGYSATFLAGFLGLIYVFRGVFTRSLDEATAESIHRMTYGIVCFATLFSLVGTVLGGIWADQSWGRFWGWDPKENGALIIVIWNAVILHARWSGLARRRGVMSMAIFGNIVTSWSWFGTNMLGVGLHSYGFTDSAFFWLLVFVVSQLSFIALSALPLEKWRGPLKA